MLSYDAFDLNARIAFDLTLEEMVGAVANDRSPFAHNCALVGVPVWTQLGNGLPYLVFDNGNPDWLECPIADTAELDYQAGDFSVAAWIYANGTDFMILCRGENNADGWYFNVTGSVLELVTNQGGAAQFNQSSAASIATGEWLFLCATRAGSVGRMFIQGVEDSAYQEAITDPLTSARKLHIGIHDDETVLGFDGGMYRPRILSRAWSASDVSRLFEMERAWFGL